MGETAAVCIQNTIRTWRGLRITDRISGSVPISAASLKRSPCHAECKY